jgi:hypothetical protein
MKERVRERFDLKKMSFEIKKKKKTNIVSTRERELSFVIVFF